MLNVTAGQGADCEYLDNFTMGFYQVPYVVNAEDPEDVDLDELDSHTAFLDPEEDIYEGQEAYLVAYPRADCLDNAEGYSFSTGDIINSDGEDSSSEEYSLFEYTVEGLDDVIEGGDPTFEHKPLDEGGRGVQAITKVKFKDGASDSDPDPWLDVDWQGDWKEPPYDPEEINPEKLKYRDLMEVEPKESTHLDNSEGPSCNIDSGFVMKAQLMNNGDTVDSEASGSSEQVPAFHSYEDVEIQGCWRGIGSYDPGSDHLKDKRPRVIDVAVGYTDQLGSSDPTTSWRNGRCRIGETSGGFGIPDGCTGGAGSGELDIQFNHEGDGGTFEMSILEGKDPQELDDVDEVHITAQIGTSYSSTAITNPEGGGTWGNVWPPRSESEFGEDADYNEVLQFRLAPNEVDPQEEDEEEEEDGEEGEEGGGSTTIPTVSPNSGWEPIGGSFTSLNSNWVQVETSGDDGDEGGEDGERETEQEETTDLPITNLEFDVNKQGDPLIGSHLDITFTGGSVSEWDNMDHGNGKDTAYKIVENGENPENSGMQIERPGGGIKREEITNGEMPTYTINLEAIDCDGNYDLIIYEDGDNTNIFGNEDLDISKCG